MTAPGSQDRVRPAGSRRTLALVAAVVLPFVLGGCTLPAFWGYRGKTTQAQDTFKLYQGTFVAALVVGVIVAALILWSIIVYRRRSDEIPRQFQYHIPLEVTYTVIPIIIVLVLFFFTVLTENNVDALSATPAVEVHVIAFQWGWTFDYANEHLSITGETYGDPDPVGLNGANTCAPAADCYGPGLVIPVGVPTRIHLTSNDVIHGFYVPEFNFSRYAQPGINNYFDLTPTKEGVYRAQCTQLCGLYHSLMYFHVVALPMVQYKAWVAIEQAAGGTFAAGSDSNLGPSPVVPASNTTPVAP
ncbi:MAG TPA: cytochrome c oxidase subunit II [Acidimicrobiales bacterium]|nr:cytochrome c oxidase subunit II [Acidimicrobiales bacterium]